MSQCSTHVLMLASALVVASCAATPERVPQDPMSRSVLHDVQSWASQLQDLDRPGALDALTRAPVDMIVVEPGDSVRDSRSPRAAEIAARLQNSPGGTRARKVCVAYLNIGQAEDYRDYWQDGWTAPTKARAGSPDFLLGLDPDGWEGNYPCRFWDPRWKAVLFGSPSSLLDRILDAGFDGAYLDWILGYSDDAVVKAAAREGIDPAHAMIELLRELRIYARARRPRFVLIAQNGVELARHPGFLEAIDALAHEDLSFRGDAGVSWHKHSSGGIDARAERLAGAPAGRPDPLLTQLRALRARGLKIFTIDYACARHDIALASKRSRAAGFVPTVSRTPLDRVPAHVLLSSPGR